MKGPRRATQVSLKVGRSGIVYVLRKKSKVANEPTKNNTFRTLPNLKMYSGGRTSKETQCHTKK